ncbi:hypothetical protein GWI33_004930 [Rhynchophorus ferrugineus]|uniref:Pectinesterase n=1 Tax=Rhynchophorus ferrugineus TaxID=354439 RepID=A0A834J2P6_RHYFE|nr:hypothetical protein GWI33_004930 [Rhynchophorus ferrugineus]
MNSYPGTETRPILSDSEAEQYKSISYLNGWIPEPIRKNQPDYLVGDGELYTSIQEAVNAAVEQENPNYDRKYIKILNGTYREVVYLPSTNTPLTIYSDPGSVRIEFNQSAETTGSEYISLVNPNGTKFKPEDPAYSMYKKCASKATLGTRCSSIFWIMGDDVEISGLTIENVSKNGQAVAVETNGDLIQFEEVNILGFQDTFYLNGDGRIFVNSCRISGDVDFVFGSARAVFLNTAFVARSDRPRTTALIFAPSTAADVKYGFLVEQCRLVANSNITQLQLARAWDGKEYIPGTSANGQLVIRDSLISMVVNETAPYASATSGRYFAGNDNPDRNLDDVKFNRFWEYQNSPDYS